MTKTLAQVRSDYRLSLEKFYRDHISNVGIVAQTLLMHNIPYNTEKSVDLLALERGCETISRFLREKSERDNIAQLRVLIPALAERLTQSRHALFFENWDINILKDVADYEYCYDALLELIIKDKGERDAKC